MPIKFDKKTDTTKSSCALVDKQIDHEFFNERLYISMAAWCDANGFPETASFFSEHSLEEREHAFDFINHKLKQGMKPHISGTKQPPVDFRDMTDVLTQALEQEYLTNEMIQNLFDVGTKEKTFLIPIAQKYLDEQLEETQLFTSLLKLWETCNFSKIDFELEVMKLRCENETHRLGKI